MKAIIIDDEPKAIALLKSYLAHFHTIHCVASFRNGLKAFEFLNQEEVDLVFLDINMPQLSGISLAKMIAEKTKIIFTTAYSEFAVESYEVKAVDYLVKPIGLERFTQAIAKVLEDTPPIQTETHAPLLLKSGTKIYPVLPSDILFLHKEGNYMTYYLETEKILVRESIAQALEVLPDYFYQCHKSYLVNSRQIRFFDKEQISVGKNSLPIGKAFKDVFIGKMKQEL